MSLFVSALLAVSGRRTGRHCRANDGGGALNMSAAAWRSHGDGLDQVQAFLERRDGVDKVLKIIRYTAKLLLATYADGGASPALAARLDSLERSLGTSRRAYRLGKFLTNVNNIRKLPVRAPFAALEILSNAGECTYYFVSQLQWLVAAGVLPPGAGPPLSRLGAAGELAGYVGSVSLSLLRIAALLEREAALVAELARRRAAGSPPGDDKDAPLVAEIRSLRLRRVMRTLGLVQDGADALLALADLRDGRGRGGGGVLGNRALLAAAGLLSGSLSAWKQWPGAATGNLGGKG